MKEEKLVTEIKAILEDKKAEDVVAVDVSDWTPFSDYYVIATAPNERAMEATAQALEDGLWEKEQIETKKEGQLESGWIVVDCGRVLVSIFTAEMRAHYQFDDLFKIAKA